MGKILDFEQVGRVPQPDDNVAIAIRKLDAGASIRLGEQVITLNHTVMEGHRFAIRAIQPGESLLSWALPFGEATEVIAPGHYVINDTALKALQERDLDFELPPVANFKENTKIYALDEAKFQPADAPALADESRTFLGYRRSERRGVGTRNMVVLLGTSSRTGSFVKQLAARLQGECQTYVHLDGIVPVAHTEGGAERPNNLQLVLRTLAGFITNPNVGAVLAVDYGNEPITNALLADYMRKHQYPLDEVPHTFLSLTGTFAQELDHAESVVQKLLPEANKTPRTAESLRHLKIGLQCGGSDAFSGVTANPLEGWVAKELIRHGGAASLAETDELIGAEPYVLQKVRDLDTARKFLEALERFRERAGWHGASAEGNPSGGNMYRGLYNIALKSIGAAQKKDPESRLDYVIEYGEAMPHSGYYFMDSPGNDLESIAGQVASGCNMIFFATGNGSITNFPYVPTIKIVTTTERYNLLSDDMDVNAGRYLEDVPMDELGRSTFELMLEIASGRLSVGEQAGHSQVQIWRDWAQTDGSRLAEILHAADPDGKPHSWKSEVLPAQAAFSYEAGGEKDQRKLGLILPTSLCAGQVAAGIVARLNAEGPHARYITLPHTEGCGNSGGDAERMFARSMVGYATHDRVADCLLLEHGCEKTHNDYMRRRIADAGGDPTRFGYASIQLDGGIDAVSDKVTDWFKARKPVTSSEVTTQGLGDLRVGLMVQGKLSPALVRQAAAWTGQIIAAGGTVVVPANSSLLQEAIYSGQLDSTAATLAYGSAIGTDGFHIMETPTRHWVETLTGLAATGVQLVVALVQERPMQAHPFVPVLQISDDAVMSDSYGDDLDLILGKGEQTWPQQIFKQVQAVLEGSYEPKLAEKGNTDIQFTRGLLGVSL